MNRVLLADDSPHAQRMGERILREEGYEVVTVTDGQTALMRLSDVDPDVVFADITLPRRNGYDVCREVKRYSRFRHIRVVLTASLLEPLNEDLAKEVGADGTLRKPFEATAMIELLKPLVEAAQTDRAQAGVEPAAETPVPTFQIPVVTVTESDPASAPAAVAVKVLPPAAEAPTPEPSPEIALPAPPAEDPADPERIRAAVVLAVEEAIPGLIDKLAEQITAALRNPNAR